MFGHEKFKPYRYAIEFAAMATQLIEKVPHGHCKLVDQFRRASTAIALNIAEGSGKGSQKERNRCYVIARGEAMECAAIVDILHCMHVVDSASAVRAREILENTVAILSSVISKNGRRL